MTLTVKRIDPTCWYTGMKNPRLQLLVWGEGIREAEFHTDYPGVEVESVARLDSPNYLFLYLNIKNAQPGLVPLRFRLPHSGQQAEVGFRLCGRAMPGHHRMGFTQADVLYLLMPDRFAYAPTAKAHPPGLCRYRVDRSKPSLRHGGNLEGVRRHLGYLQRLGVTALWLTPIQENNSPDRNGASTYHGYAITDYYRVDPRLGTADDYRRLVGQAHRKGLKVVMDMVFNHCAFDHPWVKDMPAKDWFNMADWLQQSGGTCNTRGTQFVQTNYRLTTVKDPYASRRDLRQTQQGWFVSTMPDLNQRNPHLMTYLVQNSFWWIETFGIDGIRMDTYPYADTRAMARWMKAVEEEYPHLNTVGETWVTEPAYTAAWQKGSPLARRGEDSHLPTVMDFALFERLNQAKNEQTDDWASGLNRVYNTLCYDYLYADPDHVMAFLDNHDTDRFLSDRQDAAALKQALALLLTVRRIPQIYYGTELMLTGNKSRSDGDVRQDFPGGFAGDPRNAFTAKGRTRAENALWRWLSRLLHWRQGCEAVKRGTQTHFLPHQGVYVVARRLGSQGVLTILNGTDRPAMWRAERYAELFGPVAPVAEDVVSGRCHDLGCDLRLRARQTLVLEYGRGETYGAKLS